METATAPAADTPTTGSATLADLLPASVEKYGSLPAIRFKDESGAWVSRTYDEVGQIVQNLALGLIDLGIAKGEKVAIIGNTRPEWTYFDFAALSIGATVVPIYQTNSPEECQYVLENSDAIAVIVEDDDQLAKIDKVKARCPELRHVIRMTGVSEGTISADQLAERGRSRDDADWQARYSTVSAEDICTFIYTSGTTGPPKGCIISHGNYRAMLDMVVQEGTLKGGEVTYLFLPLAHSFALLLQLGNFETGSCIAYWERDPLKIVPNLAEIQPSYFPSVPRIFEKIYTTATANAEKEGGLKKRIFHWAIDVGAKVRELERAGKSPGFLLSRQYKFADKAVLSKIRAIFGGNIENCLTGAAPINPEILRFFDACGVLVLEGWGMTETSTAATISTPENHKFGTVGKPFPGIDVRIAEDGEILVKGPNIFQGYYKRPDATAETLIDGWLHTGDIGEIDEDGFVKITGRKKDIIITAGGKNITPANLEAKIKEHPLVSQCVVIGDRRPYLVALVTLDPDEVSGFAKDDPEMPDDPAKAAQSPYVRDQIMAHVDKINEDFARVEQVKKIHILPSDLSQEAGELTPTMKVKRNVVAEKYASDVDALYG